MDEEWRPVVGYEGLYEVSDFGRVRSLERPQLGGRPGRILKPTRTLAGNARVAVTLCNRGKRSSRSVHRLVLEAFVGTRPDGMECCHFDDDPTNNNLANLRWDTRCANRQDMLRNNGHWNSRKQVCKYGHPFTPENTYIAPKTGARNCKACQRERAAS